MTTTRKKINFKNVAIAVVPFALAQALVMAYWHVDASAKMEMASTHATANTISKSKIKK